MAYCADTNILLRLTEPGTESCELALTALAALHDRGETVYITPQNIVEFWCAATRPVDVNGLGLSSDQASNEVLKLGSIFPLLPDSAAIHPEWRALVVATKTIGLKTHDARIAAALRVHEVTHILTFNVKDFKSFGRPIPVHPADVPVV